MKKLFISQPMNGKTNEEIKEVRGQIKNKVEEKLGEEVEVIDSFFENAPHEAKPLWFLGKSFEKLSQADLMSQPSNWKDYRGCRMERQAAEEYGIEIMDIDL